MFKGSFVALVTPFGEDLAVDFEAYGRLIDWQLNQGTNGIVPCGCTGEAATLSHEEQKKCIQFVVERVAGRVPVIPGTGSNNTPAAIELTQWAQVCGADGALLITPYYNKPTPDGQIAHYEAISQAVPGLSLMLYNVPGRTGTRMSPELIAMLFEKIDRVAAVKEACGSVDQVSQIRALCGIDVVSGDDALTLPMMSVGATGVVSVAAGVVPSKMAAICGHALRGDFGAARSVHYELLPLFGALFAETNPMPVKAALAKMGLIKNVLRLPLVPMTDAMFGQHLQSVMVRLELLKA